MKQYIVTDALKVLKISSKIRFLLHNNARLLSRYIRYQLLYVGFHYVKLSKPKIVIARY